MSFLCRIFTCHSKKKDVKKGKEASNIKQEKKSTSSLQKTDYNHVQRNKKQNIKEVVENIDHITKRVRFTIEHKYRYVVPVMIVNKIHEMIKREEFYPLTEINNSLYLQLDKKSFKSDFNVSEVCFVTREIMDVLLESLGVDFIIRVEIIEGKTRIKEHTVMSGIEYSGIKKEKLRNYDREDNIDKGIIYGNDVRVDFLDNNIVNDKKDFDTFNNQPKPEKNIGRETIKDINKNDKKKLKDSDIYLKEKEIELKTENACKIDIGNGKSVKRNTMTSSTPNSQFKDSKLTSNSDKSTNFTKKSNINLNSTIEGNKQLTLSPKGLYNPSVYCFMNTCMQCLLSIPELNNYFSSEAFSLEKKSKKATPSCYAMKEFIVAYENSLSSLKSPQSLYKVCHSFLEPDQQHDCQEFLRRFLSRIQEELNYNKKYTFSDKDSYEKAWSIYREVNPSFVDSIFTGLMRSSVICNKCEYKSDTYDPFLDLSVPIKKKTVENLENCLDSYFTKEFIDCEYKCSSCKKKTSISKKLEIVISPPILTIHIKRFEDLRHKYNGSIEFSETLDLLTYTSQEVYESLQYELFAVAVHLGRSIFSGHYVAYAKRNGKWYNFNDSSVFTASLEEALTNNAYVLFFRRID